MPNTIPSAVAMVRPAAFGFNPETAASNAFQNRLSSFSSEQIQDIALIEFNAMVETLKNAGIEVLVFNDRVEDNTPDSIFPNNWFSSFTNEIILYSMFSKNRGRERKDSIITSLATKLDKKVNKDLLDLEDQELILEGTGSLVCDYRSKTAFAALSPRTTNEALDKFESITSYSTCRFRANGPDGNEIYHTNVMMCIADEFAVIGLDTIIPEDKPLVINTLKKLGKEIIPLSNSQVFDHFAGNMLQLRNAGGQKFLVMSAEAKRSLKDDQIELITKKYNHQILAPAIHMIEKIGGGSARCMMAELFYNYE